jgi:hypothetical protein
VLVAAVLAHWVLLLHLRARSSVHVYCFCYGVAGICDALIGFDSLLSPGGILRRFLLIHSLLHSNVSPSRCCLMSEVAFVSLALSIMPPAAVAAASVSPWTICWACDESDRDSRVYSPTVCPLRDVDCPDLPTAAQRYDRDRWNTATATMYPPAAGRQDELQRKGKGEWR